MCGFVAILMDKHEAPVDTAALHRATTALHHRGPDDEGHWHDGPIAMGFRRLSILDLSPAGHQPMHSDCGRYVIVFNGEIYNFLELRAELQASGDRFRSDSDTEVILAAFRRWGAGCFARFNGMWALCIWDRQERTLTVSRDRFGIKPLYIAHRHDRWVLGSELPALRHVDPLPRLPDLVQAADYLSHGFIDHDHRAAIEGYERVPPGCWATLRPGDREPALHRYYQAADAIDRDLRRRLLADNSGRETQNFAEELRETIVDATRLRLRADVPVGTCLSGGLDSVSIVCATARVTGEERASNARHAFSAMMQHFDETPYINATIAQTGVQLTRADLSASAVLASAEHVLKHHDEPVHSLTPIAGSLVFRAAQEQGVTVLLNGQGADELLAGYGSFVPYYVRSLLTERGPAAALRQWRKEGVTRDTAMVLLRQVGGALGARAAALARSRRGVADSMLSSDVANGTSGRCWLDRKSPPTGLQAALDESLTAFPLPLFLRVEDRNAMSWSREARLPYLDPRVVRLCRTAPAALKRRDGLNKWIQRRALHGLIPELVRQRPDKMGFPSPQGIWMRGPLKELVLDVLSEHRLQARGIYDVERVISARDEVLRSDAVDCRRDLLRVFLYEGWARNHLD